MVRGSGGRIDEEVEYVVTKRGTLTKQDILKSIEALPDDVTINDVIDHLCYLSGIEEGLADVEAGRIFTHEEVVEHIKSWLK